MDGNMFTYFNSIIPASTTALNEQNLTQLINISPNPSTGKFYINFTDVDFKQTKIQVTTIYGAQILEYMVDKSTPIAMLDLSAYPKGIYFIHSKINNQPLHAKLIKE
jgi:hypothetical protein